MGPNRLLRTPKIHHAKPVLVVTPHSLRFRTIYKKAPCHPFSFRDCSSVCLLFFLPFLLSVCISVNPFWIFAGIVAGAVRRIDTTE